MLVDLVVIIFFFPRHGNAKYPPIPLPWPTKNENIMADNTDKAKVEGVYESKLFNKTSYI